jgi:hypothetical protein
MLSPGLQLIGAALDETKGGLIARLLLQRLGTLNRVGRSSAVEVGDRDS